MRIIEENLPATTAPYAQGLRDCLQAFAAALPVQRVILFGSHARGEATAESDVDLCVVARGIESQHRAAVTLRRAVGLLRHKPALSLVPISPERLREKLSRGDPFFQTVLREGVCIAQDD
jgi:predicted nucleotidyltransferase